ncbi:MAG: glycerophosphodiester phosphodiesterase family protein [Planctomycetota bacterium]
MLVRILSLLIVLGLFTGCSSSLDAYPWSTLNGEPPIIIAHRGDSGNYPEHTLLAYESAIQLKADYIEPDVVLTGDGAVVCRHDLFLSTTTDVARQARYASRRREHDGRSDWFVQDFTLGELKSLQAVQPVNHRNPADKTRQHVPLLSEVIELANRLDEGGHDAGLYIEIKKPAEHRAAGLDPSQAVLDAVEAFRQAGDCPPIILQCFDRNEAERIAEMTDDPVVWLSSNPIDFDSLPKGIAGLGLNKKLIEIVDGRSQLIEQAHRRGLFIHVWTFCDDDLEGTGFEDGQSEIEAYLQAGVDGVFTDFPKTGVAARQAVFDRWQRQQDRLEDKPLSKRIRENSPRRLLRAY